MHDDVAGSEKLQVRQVKSSLFSSSASRGYNMLLHSEQKRNVICSRGFFSLAPPAVLEGAGDDMLVVDVCDGCVVLCDVGKLKGCFVERRDEARMLCSDRC